MKKQDKLKFQRLNKEGICILYLKTKLLAKIRKYKLVHAEDSPL